MEKINKDEIDKILSDLPEPPIGQFIQIAIVLKAKYILRKQLEEVEFKPEDKEITIENIINNFADLLTMKTDDPNKPRLLEPEEIEEILQVIPDLPPNRTNKPVLFPVIGRMIQSGIKERLRQQLSRLRITPLVLEDNSLKGEINRQYRKALIRMGRPVGFDAAGAFGETMTQSTLNTFHLTGVSSNVTGGIKGFQEVMTASPKRSLESSTIHFVTDDFDLRDVSNLKSEISHLTVKDLVKNHTVEQPEEFFENEQRSVIVNGQKQLEIMYHYPFWYYIYLSLKNINLTGTWFLRLYLDLKLMYSRGITMAELCKIIKEDSSNTVECVPSPLHMGILDIYPVNASIPNMKIDLGRSEIDLAYLSTNIYANLSKITIRGISDIKDLKASKFKVWNTIIGESWLSDYSFNLDMQEKENVPENRFILTVRKRWKLTMDTNVFKVSSLTIESIAKLVRAVGIEIESTEGDKSITIIMPEEKEFHPLIGMKENLPKMLKNRRITIAENNIMNKMFSNIDLINNILPLYQNDRWYIKFGHENMYNYNQIKTIVKVIKLLGYNPQALQRGNDYYLEVTNIPQTSPTNYVNNKINTDRLNWEKSRDDGSPPLKSEIARAATYYFAFTEGNNLKALLRHEDIDSRYVFSNNVHDNLELFGIEATRLFLILEFLGVMAADGASVNVQHILLLVDYMTRTGSITKISAKSVTNRPGGTLQKTTVAQALETFLLAGAFGKRDRGLKEVSSSIMVGKIANIGTAFGEGDYPEFVEARNKYIQNLRTGLSFSPSPTEFEKAIDNTIDRNFGLDTDGSESNKIIKLEPVIEQKPLGRKTMVTDSRPISGIREDIINKLTNPPIISNNLSDIINKINTSTCRPTQEIIMVEARIPIVNKTTSLPTFIGEQLVEKELPLPDVEPSASLAIPQNLLEDINAILSSIEQQVRPSKFPGSLPLSNLGQRIVTSSNRPTLIPLGRLERQQSLRPEGQVLTRPSLVPLSRIQQ